MYTHASTRLNTPFSLRLLPSPPPSFSAFFPLRLLPSPPSSLSAFFPLRLLPSHFSPEPTVCSCPPHSTVPSLPVLHLPLSLSFSPLPIPFSLPVLPFSSFSPHSPLFLAPNHSSAFSAVAVAPQPRRRLAQRPHLMTSRPLLLPLRLRPAASTHAFKRGVILLLGTTNCTIASATLIASARVTVAATTTACVLRPPRKPLRRSPQTTTLVPWPLARTAVHARTSTRM